MNYTAIRPSDAAWRRKADKLIGELSFAAWRAANTLPNGRKRKRHVPYTIPVEAAVLVDCLNRNDEHGAKALFMRLHDVGPMGPAG